VYNYIGAIDGTCVIFRVTKPRASELRGIEYCTNKNVLVVVVALDLSSRMS
jgi:hypothetical protein